MAKIFLKLMMDIKLYNQEAQIILSKITTKKSTPLHVIFKLQKIINKEHHITALNLILI